jgi:hypothetical protein
MEIFCPYCARTTRLIYVHGHGQCEICKIYLEPCCQGRNTTEASAHAPDKGQPSYEIKS